MSFTVIGAPLSPFARKVHIVMDLKKIEFTMDPVSPFNLPEGYEKINPVKRIPVLKHDDLYIRDSAVICRYLEDLYPDPQLAVGSPLIKAQIAWFERLADTELAPAISATAFRHRVVYRAMGKPFDEAEIDAVINEQAPPLYDYLDESIGQNKFLVGDQVSLADIAVVSQFINASLGNENVDKERWPNLARYIAEHFESDTFARRIASARKMVAKMLAG
jgi:glutathione S-transferase